MSEKVPQNSPERVTIHEVREPLKHTPEAKTPTEQLPDNLEISTEDLESIRDQINSEALPTENFDVETDEGTSAATMPLGLQQQLKDNAYQQSLQKVQSKLSEVEKSFSRVIHQPVVDSISTTASKTAARPSGLLGGSITALVGSCLLLYVSKHYGFQYNYQFFLLFFLGGFVVGIGIEVIVRLILRIRN